jgi:hypothetical protein
MLKSYVKASIEGAGALEGAPCQIQGVVDNQDGTQTITFLWEDNDGESHTTTVNVPSAIYDFALLQDGQIMAYDSTDGKWKNATLTYDNALNDSSENAPQTKVVFTALDEKVDKVEGKGLSTNDFTDELKQKVEDSVDTISVNGVSQTITDGEVDLDIANNLITEAQWAQLQNILQ